MTFLEFLNKKDDSPLSPHVKPPKISGLQVVKDFSKSLKAPSITKPNISLGKAPLPTGLMGRRPSERNIASKPSDFLARRGSSFRKDF